MIDLTELTSEELEEIKQHRKAHMSSCVNDCDYCVDSTDADDR